MARPIFSVASLSMVAIRCSSILSTYCMDWHGSRWDLKRMVAGCIFHYDDDFPQGSGKGFKEADKPNFTGSYYSYTKAMLESLLRVGAGAVGLVIRRAACLLSLREV